MMAPRRRSTGPDKGRYVMAFKDLTLVGFLKTRMQWHQSRQNVLAQNVANADTPGYRPHDLKPMRFEQHLRGPAVTSSVSTARTHNAHFSASVPAERPAPGVRAGTGWEITPAGNGVVLEEQMIKVSENQFDFQLASTLYSRSLGLIKTALGRNS